MASLRVYEPIETFNSADQKKWLDFATQLESYSYEQKLSLFRLIKNKLIIENDIGSHILDLEGKKYVAPWSIGIRCIKALEEFKSSLPNSVVKLFIPEQVEKFMESASEIIENRATHILTSNWSIPPRWFTPFIPEDKVFKRVTDSLSVVFRTTISNAKQRVAFAHKTVLNTFGTGPIESEIADLINWLSIFDSQSIVELDYGGLATHMNNLLTLNGSGGLEADTSVEDVLTSISGLAAGDGAKANLGYERLVSRWRKMAALESAT